jgi:hypothetical protein
MYYRIYMANNYRWFCGRIPNPCVFQLRGQRRSIVLLQLGADRRNLTLCMILLTIEDPIWIGIAPSFEPELGCDATRNRTGIETASLVCRNIPRLTECPLDRRRRGANREVILGYPRDCWKCRGVDLEGGRLKKASHLDVVVGALTLFATYASEFGVAPAVGFA